MGSINPGMAWRLRGLLRSLVFRLLLPLFFRACYGLRGSKRAWLVRTVKILIALATWWAITALSGCTAAKQPSSIFEMVHSLTPPSHAGEAIPQLAGQVPVEVLTQR